MVPGLPKGTTEPYMSHIFNDPGLVVRGIEPAIMCLERRCLPKAPGGYLVDTPDYYTTSCGAESVVGPCNGVELLHETFRVNAQKSLIKVLSMIRT